MGASCAIETEYGGLALRAGHANSTKSKDSRNAAKQLQKGPMIGQSQHFGHSSCCNLAYESRLAWLQISMIDGALFDALEALARGIRGKQEPFGGIQLILAGLMRDFSTLYIQTATCCCAVSQRL